MDDFLGTSIQYSEQQIKLLEQEHAANLQKTVEELIESGFLDSDYDDSTDNESSDSEEIKENSNYDSPSIESLSDSQLNISPKSLDNNSPSTDPPSDFEYDNQTNKLELVLAPNPDISAVDESLSNSGIIKDADSNSNIIGDTIDNKENDIEIESVESIAINDIINYIFGKMHRLLMFLILFVVLHFIHNEHNPTNCHMYGGLRLQHDLDGFSKHSGQTQHDQQQHYPQFARTHEVYWCFEELQPSQSRIINEEEDERDEYDDIQRNNKHVLGLDIMTTTLDKQTNTIYHAKYIHREFYIEPNDLQCNDAQNIKINVNMNSPSQLSLLFHFGLKSPSPITLSAPMIRVFKTTLSERVGSPFIRNSGLATLLFSFMGITYFMFSNDGFEETLSAIST